MSHENSPTVGKLNVVRIDALCKRLQLSKAWIYQQVALDNFPRPISLGARAVGWVEAEIDEWIEQRIAESRDGGDA